MSRVFVSVGIGLLTWGAGAPDVRAGAISLETQAQATVERQTLTASVTLTNRGDEPAYAVQVVAENHEFSWTSPMREQLPVNEPHAVTLEHAVSGMREGRHPLIIRVRYTDANRYPFSALTVTEFTVGQHVAPDLLAILNPITMRHQGTMALRLKNLAPQARRVSIRAVLPHELSAEPSSMKQELAAHQEAQVSFRVKNFSALSGSTYVVFALIEDDHDGRHHTTVASGSVRVHAVTVLQRFRFIWAAIGAALLLLLLILNLRHARKPR